jgi:hypothetical protein
MTGLDDRIVQVGIELNNGINYYEGLAITARGTKFGNQNLSECQVRIDNLTRAHRDFILKETSPFNFNRSPKKLIVNAGRKSYGTAQIFIGNITTSEITQPPDIGIILNALTGYETSLETISVSMPPQSSLLAISQKAANDIGTGLNFQATDKTIANYGFTGKPLEHVNKIQEAGNFDAFVDNNVLVVKDRNVPLPGLTRKLSLENGMVGIPEITETGIRVRMLLDNATQLGGQIELTSQLNPSLNGRYGIYKLSFDIASRDVPFYWIAECGYIKT